jgi:hypothetical protein
MTATAADPPDLTASPFVPSEVEGRPLPMTPGRYLRLRREAAGLTIQHVVLMVVPARYRSAPDDRADLRNRIALAEEDALWRPALPPLLDQLGGAFNFVPGIYWLLAVHHEDPGRPIRIPRICRSCGCTEHDACHMPVQHAGDAAATCAWVEGDRTLCTACELAGKLVAAPAPAERELETSDAA